MWLLGLLYTSCLKILRHSIPRTVDASNTTELILDCEYVYDSNDMMLVVKWFHNSSPEPIYQWIPERKVRHVGELLKQRFDMNFSINPNDEFSKYRAVKLRHNITVDLSGNFSCVISSIAGQDLRQGQMVVYGKYLILTQPHCLINMSRKQILFALNHKIIVFFKMFFVLFMSYKVNHIRKRNSHQNCL